jgi:hypothetical protein
MGNLTVYFVGICTHLREFTSRETEHRVVLINAREGKEINGRTIVQHEATLRYLDLERTPRHEPLNGVRITIKNPSTTDIAYDKSFFTCIPRLTTYAPNIMSLSLDVAKGHDPNLVAAYFDITAGRLIAGADANDASVAVLNVPTDGNPILSIETFPGHPNGQATKQILLPPDAHIQLENVGPGLGHGEGPHDFLLNLLVAQVIPPDATWPTTRADCKLDVALPFRGNTVDPGCSNSNYP